MTTDGADTRPEITSPADTSGRDAMLAAVRDVPSESGQVQVLDILLTRSGPVLRTQNHAGFESDHHLDYPASFEEVSQALEIEDENAVVRSEMCAAVLTWMADHEVPTSDGFEEFFRWAVFADLVLDEDALAIINRDGTPASLPVGWLHEPVEDDDGSYIHLTLERPHAAAIRDDTWIVMRADGWSSLLFATGDWIGEGPRQVPCPDFVAVRPSDDDAEIAAWFRNEDVDGATLIEFALGYHRAHD